MRRSLIPAALLSLLLVGAVQDKEPPAATANGTPVSCIWTQQLKETRVRSDQVIDFVMRDGKVYRNTLPFGCPRLGFERRFAHRTPLHQYCSTDTITVLGSPGLSQGASCGLGEFQPVTLADPKK